MKVLQLLCGNDYFNDAYGSGTTFNEEAARQDWEAARVFLLPEFERYNPGRTCWAAARFDGAEVPSDQTSFSGFRKDKLLNQFPAGT